MRKTSRMYRIVLLAVVVMLGMVALSKKCHAADFGTALTSTFAQIPVAADQAAIPTVALEDFSSPNPAVIAAGQDYKVGAQATYGFVTFKNGPTLQLEAGSVAAKLPKEFGTLQFTYVHANSRMSPLDPFDSLGFDGIYSFDLQYGKKVGSSLLLSGDELFLGAEFTHTESKLRMASFDPTVPMTATAGSKTRSNGGTVGFYYKPTAKLRFGGLYAKAWETEEDVLSIDGAAVGSDSFKSQTDTLRVGSSFQVFPLTTIAADYQHVYVKGGSIDQYSIGLEQYIVEKALALYVSTPNGGVSAGVGLYFDKCGINVTYQHKPFQDLEKYLGRSDLFMVSLYGNF